MLSGDLAMFDILSFIVSIWIFLGVYLILAFSLNFEMGYAGQPNYGQVLFYAVGAYAGAIVSDTIFLYAVGHGGIDIFSSNAVNLRLALAGSTPFVDVVSFIGSLIAAVAIGAIFGYVASYPALRLSRDYLSIVLFLLAEAGRIVAREVYPISGGAYGSAAIINPFAWLGGGQAIYAAYAGVIAILVVTTYVLTQRVVNSPFGRLMKSIRDDDFASRTYGKHVAWRRGQVMIYGSALAALAGALFAHYAGYVNPDDFVSSVTIDIWVILVLGGIANMKGMIAGGVAVVFIDRITRLGKFELIDLGINIPFDLNYLRYVLVGIIMILVLMYHPKGLIPEEPVNTPAIGTVERDKNTQSS